MELLRLAPLRGPNPYTAKPVFEVVVSTRGWRNGRTARLVEQLQPHLPLLCGEEMQPSRLAASGHGRARMSRDMGSLLRDAYHAGAHRSPPVPEILECLVRSFQFLAGVNAEFGEIRETDESDVWTLVFEFEEERLARACLEAAVEVGLAAADQLPLRLPERIKDLVDLADDVRLGPSTRAIVDAAKARGIPCRRMNYTSLVQLGEGCRQRRIWTAETDATSAIAESIASDKDLTKKLLAAAGVPVPRGRVVSSAEDAWAAACEIGLPAVVKPQNANHARGVSLDLRHREQVLGAYDYAVELGDGAPVMVEQFGRGQQHRLLVVGDRMIAAACGEGEFVVGDGRQSVEELVEEANRNPLRGVNYTNQLSVLRLNHSAIDELSRQGLKLESVPESGRRVMVQRIGDLTMDCTNRVHSEVAARAVLAAQTVGLDIAGLDVVAEDISRPLEEQRGMILEVNAGPSLSMHIAPLHGEPQPVGQAIVSMIYPAGKPATIPIALITGTGDRPLVADRLARLLQSSGFCTGLATSRQRRFGTHQLDDGNWTDWSNLESLLMHRHLEAAVCESRPEQAAREGLASPRSDVVIVTQDRVKNDGRSELDRAGILAALNSLAPAGTLVLAVDDPDAELFATRHPGPIYWIASSSINERLLRSDDVIVALRGANVTASGPNRSWSTNCPDGVTPEHSACMIVPAVAAWMVISGSGEARNFEAPR